MPMTFSHAAHSRPHSTGAVMKRRVNARAWKPEEEAYLLRARGRAIPYKQIGAQLNKTELACRLHFHQMSYGANRRKEHGLMVDARSNASCSPRSPYTDFRSSLPNPAVSVSYPSSSTSLIPTTAEFSQGHAYSTPAKYYRQPTTGPYQPFDGNSSVAENSRPAVAWQELAGATLALSPTEGNVDITRLLYRYADNSRAFWSNIAEQYSEVIEQSPTNIESAFLNAPSGADKAARQVSTNLDDRYLEPTTSMDEAAPGRSLSKSRDPLNGRVQTPSPKRCTVSSLLNTEKDNGLRVWAVNGA